MGTTHPHKACITPDDPMEHALRGSSYTLRRPRGTRQNDCFTKKMDTGNVSSHADRMQRSLSVDSQRGIFKARQADSGGGSQGEGAGSPPQFLLSFFAPNFAMLATKLSNFCVYNHSVNVNTCEQAFF